MRAFIKRHHLILQELEETKKELEKVKKELEKKNSKD